MPISWGWVRAEKKPFTHMQLDGEPWKQAISGPLHPENEFTVRISSIKLLHLLLTLFWASNMCTHAMSLPHCFRESALRQDLRTAALK